MKKGNLAAILLAVTSFISVIPVIQAQEYQQTPAPPSSSPALQPEPGVAHISLIHGEVSMLRGDSGDWASTTLNTPLVRGDQVATGDKSRTEIQLDYANVVRLSSRSQIRIADLTRTRIQLQLSQGYANFTTFKGTEADAEIDTPNVAVRPLKHGRYRIQVNSDAETDVIVREGEAEITTPQGSTTLKEGHQMTIRGLDNPEYRVVDAPGTDDWDRWNKDRDKWTREADGWRRTNQYYTGVNDLDTHGHWDYVPDYGWVWAPYQTVGWAPYQYGRWVWEPYFGWTWVSYEPWGWAPYHYGRWFIHAGFWYWWPGPVHVHYRPLWAPAYVAFIGFGPSVSFGFGFGSIGWIPCGPHDYFYPWYGRGFNRIHVTNIVNVTNITNVNNVVVPPLHGVRGREPLISNVRLAMTDARVRQGITTVSAEDFGRGVAPSRRQGIDEGALKQAQVVTGNLPVVPTRESLLSTNRGATPVVSTAMPKTSDRFFVKNQPPAGPPAFQDQANQVREVIRVHGGGAQTTVGAQTTADGQQVGPGGNRGNAGAGLNPVVGARTTTDGERIGPTGNRSNAGTGLNPTVGAQTTTGGERIGPGGNRGNASTGLNPTVGAQTTTGGQQAGPGSERPEGTKPTVSVSPAASSAGHEGWNTFGKPRKEGGFTGSEAETTVAQNSSNSGSAQQGASGQNNGNNNQNKNGDRGEWRKFGNRNQGSQPAPNATPAERGSGSTTPTPMPMERPGQGQEGNTSTPKPMPAETAPPARNEPPQQNDRTNRPSPDWNRFPTASGSSTSHTSSDGTKPPLTIEPPIVRPRTGGSGGNEPRPMPPTPAPRSEPRYTPPSPSPAPAPRMEPPTRSATPAPHSEPHSAPSGGGGNSGGGNHGGSSGSKSDTGGHHKDN